MLSAFPDGGKEKTSLLGVVRLEYDSIAHCSHYKDYSPTQHSILFKRQSEVVDPIDPSFPHFYIFFYILLNFLNRAKNKYLTER